MNRVVDPRDTDAISRDPPDTAGTPIERPHPAKKNGKRAATPAKRNGAGGPLPGEDES